MNLTKKLLLGFVALIVVFLLISFFLPSKMEMSRSTVIKADPSVVFGVVSDFGQFNNYSPWHEMDPEAKTMISGNKDEKGYTYAWDGEKTGKGSMTLLESNPNNMLTQDLFFADYDAHSLITWTFEQTPEGVKTTWAMASGETSNPLMRFMNAMMKGGLGDQFDQGLTKLKDYCEKMPASTMEDATAPTDSISEEMGS